MKHIAITAVLALAILTTACATSQLATEAIRHLPDASPIKQLGINEAQAIHDMATSAAARSTDPVQANLLRSDAQCTADWIAFVGAKDAVRPAGLISGLYAHAIGLDAPPATLFAECAHLVVTVPQMFGLMFGRLP